MGKAAECQHETVETLTEETSGGRFEDWRHREVCEADAHYYRSCGAGCKLVIAFCDSHGGDERARKAMVEHVAAVHPEFVEKK
jgi:hypothetical protein